MSMPLVHDLIRIAPARISPACAAVPDWIARSLEAAPWVVVRRATAGLGKIAVGVRGPARHQRWGGFLDQSQIEQVLAPCALRSYGVSRARLQLKAFQSLAMLEETLDDAGLAWGPGGSVAFEMVSGLPSVNSESDLDVVVRCAEFLDRGRAKGLLEIVSRAPSRVDLRIETPIGGFALEEYCRPALEAVLVRTATDSFFLRNPWETEKA